jgi:MraZ protein
MERLSASLDRLNPFSDEYDDFANVIFGASVQLPFDGEGRIILPEQLIDHAGVAERVAFVGRGATFQIWEPGALDSFQGAARARARDNRSALELDPPGGVPGGGGER